MKKELPKMDMNINTLDELFTTEEDRQNEKGERIVSVQISELHNFKDHPFQVRDDEEMVKLVESIKTVGVQSPVIVRPSKNGDGYEVISGHRRKAASIYANLETIPVIIRDLTDDEATILMVDTNIQRENVLPSEKGFAYKMKLNAMSKQGKRTDLTSDQLGPKLKRTNKLLAEETGENVSQIKRFIRITYLIPELIEYVDGTREDKKKIALNPAVELSFLTEEQQHVVLSNVEQLDSTPSLSQSQRMKELNKKGRLNEDVIYAIMTEEKPNQKEKISFKSEEIDKYFPKSYTPRQKTDMIKKLLEEWHNKKRSRDAPSR